MLPHLNYLLTLIFLIVTSLAAVEANKKSLHQAGDKDRGQDAPSTGATEHSKGRQLADPEYIKRELKEVISREVDADKDGQVSYEELKKYLAVLHEKNIEYNVNKQWVVYSPQIHEVFSWEGYEPEKREVLTWDHYFNQTYPELVGVDLGIPIVREQDTASILSLEEAEAKKGEEEKRRIEREKQENEVDPHLKMLKQMVRRADARWKLADENGDTLLTKDEFKHLLHPDEGHEGLKELFVQEATEDMDLDKDNKICLDEFMKHLQVLASDQERQDLNWLSSQQENFGRFLDKNKDGVLDGEEIKNWLVPAKSIKHETEAKRLLDIGDANDDHKISMAELLEHYEHYLSLLPAEYWSSADDVEDNSDQIATMMMGDQGSRDEL